MMKTINDIDNLKDKCTGCMACVDVCSLSCISSFVADDGFKYTRINYESCVKCGKCLNVCPLLKQEKNITEQHLYAAYSLDSNVRNGGSSGGVYGELARHFLEEGYYVCGAAFDEMKLKHRLINSEEDLTPLFKSKYIQSDMEGVYDEILGLLKKGERVFYCGTPCQVSALKNVVPQNMQENLFLADIICHGVPSQKVFDDYIKTLEKTHKGNVSDFTFRVKDHKHYKHVHGYSYKVTKVNKSFVVNGIYSNSSFYNAFKKYLIFRNGCYDCSYATLKRVSDITLADFWGIEKYDPKIDINLGVSMVITNTAKGNAAFLGLSERVSIKEYPIQYGIDSNRCLTQPSEKPALRDKIIEEIFTKGYEQTAKMYFGCSFTDKVYWFLPPRLRYFIKGTLRKLKGR